MNKNLTPELKALKEDFDFLHKKIGETEWEIATIYLGRKGILMSEKEALETQLFNYRENISILLDKVKKVVSETNTAKK